jgi:hypothetical protein
VSLTTLVAPARINIYPNIQTPSAVTSFILAMTLHPLVQTRAQAELDAVIGSPGDTDIRLPTFTDRERLPYVNAIVKEVLRWNPSVPLGEFTVNCRSAERLLDIGKCSMLRLPFSSRRLAPHGHRGRCLSRLSH